MRFEWDPKKAAKNPKKHGVTFQRMFQLKESCLHTINFSNFNPKGVQFPAACCVKIIRFDVGFDTPLLAAGLFIPLLGRDDNARKGILFEDLEEVLSGGVVFQVEEDKCFELVFEAHLQGSVTP